MLTGRMCFDIFWIIRTLEDFDGYGFDFLWWMWKMSEHVAVLEMFFTCFSFIEVLYQFGSETFRPWIFHEVFISVWWRIFIWLIFFLRGFLCTNIVIVILPYNYLSLVQSIKCVFVVLLKMWIIILGYLLVQTTKSLACEINHNEYILL